MDHDTTDGPPLWRVSALQGLFFIAVGAGLPFFSLYCKNVLMGSDGNPAYYLIGLVFFIEAILGIVATPLAGIICDKFKIENRLLTLLSVTVVIGAAIVAIPGFKTTADWNLGRRFLFLLSGFIIIGLFVRPIVPLIDTETLNVLHDRFNSGIRYGQIRMFGAIGWIISASVFGWILNLTKQLNLSVIGYGAGFVVVAVIASGGFRPEIRPIRIPWEHLKRDRMFQRFLIFVFIQSLGLMSAFTFTSFFMDDVNTSFLVIGASIGLAAIPEVPIMFLSNRIIETLGNRWMIACGTLIEAVKLLLFVLIAQSLKTWIFLPVQLLHGLGYSLQYVGMINLIDRQSHVDLRAIYQSLFHFFLILASAFGSLFASFIIKHLNSSWLMGIDSLILMLSIGYFLVVVKGHGPLAPMEHKR